MTEDANGRPHGAAAEPACDPHKRVAAGQDLNDMLLSAGPDRVADMIETGDNLDALNSVAIAGGQDFNDMLANSEPGRIADLIEHGDDVFDAGAGAEGAAGAANAAPRSWGFDIEEMNRSYALVKWSGKAVVINEQPSGPINDRVRVMSVESLNSWYANRFTEIVGSDGKVRTVTWARAWHSHRDRRSYKGVEFWPNPDGVPGTPDYLNFWRGFDVVPSSSSGTYKTFRDHLLNQVCNGDPALFSYVFGWMAHIVQKPRERLGTALVLRGKKGTGKSKVGEILGSLFASHYFQVDDARYITGNFNAHMASCLLLQADEAVWAGAKDAEGRLKGLITGERQLIESKGVDPIRLENFVHVIMTSNEGWVVPASSDERRFIVLDVNPRCAQDRPYFAEMDAELNNGGRERLLHDLLTFDLKQVDLWRLPQTQALLDQKLRSLDQIDDFVFNKLYDGSDWPSVVPINEFYADYQNTASRMGIGRKRNSAEFGTRLAAIFPGLDTSRPWLEREPGVRQRVRCYQLPSLAECRECFDNLMGQPIDWPALPPGEGERARDALSDDCIPA